MVKIDRITNMIEQPDVWLCHRNYDKICKLSYIDDLKIYVTANAVDEVALSLHKYNNGVEFEYWEQLKDLKIVLVDGFGYFEIAVDKQVSDDTKKVITGISTEAELGQITIDGLEINGEIDRNDDNNWDNYGKYIPTVLYNETDTSHSLLHRLLSKAPHWKLDNIADIITDNNEPVSTSLIYRTFNFDGTNIYDALQEIAAEFDVVFRFNTVSRSINMYDLNTIGEDTTVHVSTQNLATDFTCTSNKDSIKNCFKIVGGDDNINAAIRAVNPNGSNYIYHPSLEQMEDMSEGLRTKLTNYEEYFESLKTEYNECCNDLYNAIDDYYNLKTSMMPGKTPDEETDIDKEIAKLTSSKIGNIPVQSLTTLYQTGAEKAILTIAQVIVDYRYEVTINSGLYDTTTHTWTGKFKVTNTTNSSDAAVSTNDVVLTFVEDEKEYLQDKIDELVKDVSVEDVNIEKFKENLTYYALDSLEQFVNIYAECTKVLEKYSYKDKVEEKFYELYYSYWEKWQACISERDIRKEQVATAEKMVEKYQEHVDTYHEMLDFEHFMGDYYKEFCLYRREDTYQNDNYISDGLDNSNTLQNAKKLVEVATKELIKASLFQTTYTANLNNLFTNPIYKPFYEHFDLFNWIHAEIDGKQIMLRLIGITFDFSSIEKIEVEFSEQVRNVNGITDLESILGQAKSMATSYSSTLKQAQNGQEACLEFDTIKQEGLNSALMNIKNSNNEEVVIDNCGINCRSKDQNDQYDQCQLRITGKNIVLTKDDFETASMAIGAGSYKGQEVYGVWGDLICGDILVGEELNILNPNNTLTMDENGLTITNGVNTIIFDPNNTELMNVTNNDKKIFYLNELGDLFIDGNIFGGSLHLENDNGVYVDIDPEKSDIMEIGKDYIDVKKVPQNWKRATNGGTFSGGDTFNGFSQEDSYYYSKYNVTKLVCQNQTICIDGVNYLVFLTKLKKYQNGTWITLGDFESVSGLSDRDYNKCYGNNFIVKRKENDGYIYIVCYSHGSSNDTHGCIIRYDINNQKFEKVNTYSMTYISSADASSYVMQGDVIYKAEDDTYTSISGGYSHKLTLNYTGGEITPVSWNNGKKQIRECFIYNNEFYAIIGYNNTNSLVKIDNIETISYTTSIPLQGTSANIYNEQYVYFVPILNGNHVYIYFLNDYSDMSNAQNSKISCRIVNLIDNTYVDEECELYLDTRIGGSNSYNSTDNNRRGVFGICENGEIHLFNGAIKASYPWAGRYSSAKYSYSWYGNPTYLSNEEHYVYNPSEEYELSSMIEEKQTGRNFLSSQQKCFTQIKDVIYCINSNFTFDNGETRYENSTYAFTMNNYVKKLDLTTSDDANWQLVGTISTTTSGYHVKFRNIIQSNSNTYVYIHYCYTDGSNVYNGIARFDTITNTFTYYNGTEWVDDYTLSSSVSASGNIEFGYYDEANNVLYSISSTAFSKIENFATSTDIYTHLFSMISNIIWDVDKAYFVASYGVDYRLYSLTFDGDLTELQQIPSKSYSDTTGFSIAKIEDIISIIYSNYDTLHTSFYFYNTKANMLQEKFGMFKDTGLYTVETSEFGTSSPYRTCFVPQIATGSGIHMFIGKPQFENKNANINGGYKHYIMQLTEKEIEQTTIDKRIFYVTENGDGYFYGNVYAKDGIFKGDIIAKSLTLGEGVTLNTSDISGMDDYVLTDVGLGTESGTYCKIGKDGLLTAKNAIISGQANIGEGYIGGWEIGDNGLKSVGFDDTSITNGIRLDKSGEIRSKGSWYSSVDGSGVEGWFSRLCSGKWIFGYYDSTQSDPFVPPTGTPYSDISVNGIYMCSKDTILNKSSQYLFAVDTTNDTVSITNSSSNSPALTITNNYFSDDNSYDAPALVLHSPKQGYRNRPLDVRMRVTGEILGTGQSVNNEYCMQMFGEQEYGRIIFRSSKIVGTVNDDGTVTYAPEGNTADTESSDPLVPSMIGSSTFRWFQGYFMELYSTNGLNTSSDKKIKNHIQDIDANKSLELINSLTPVEYTLKNNANNRKHMGFYAQDVKKTCDDMELGNMSLYAATWHKDGQEQECYYSEDAPDEELQWTLKYEEFIAPLVGAVQALTKRVEDLEADNEKLRTRIEKLEDASE